MNYTVCPLELYVMFKSTLGKNTYICLAVDSRGLWSFQEHNQYAHYVGESRGECEMSHISRQEYDGKKGKKITKPASSS
mgnify:CR=1 FL=1